MLTVIAFGKSPDIRWQIWRYALLTLYFFTSCHRPAERAMTNEQAAAEMQKFRAEIAIRQAPLLAAKHGLTVAQAERILIAYTSDKRGEADRGRR